MRRIDWIEIKKADKEKSSNPVHPANRVILSDSSRRVRRVRRGVVASW
jgi:hypothetical protein